MKRLTFTLSVFLLVSLSAHAQNMEVCKWLEDNAEWFYTPWSMTSIPTLVKIEVVDETTIGDRRCAVLGVIKDDVLIEESRLTVFYDRDLEQVFFYENEEWKLILNFSSDIEVGDVIEYHLPQNFEYYDLSSTSGEFMTTANSYKVEVKEIKTIDNGGEEITSVYALPVPDDENDCFSIGTIYNGIGSNNGLFGHNCTQLTAGFGEYLRCFKSAGLSFSPKEDCIPFGKKWFGEEESTWKHCLLVELGDPYTVDVNTSVVDFYKDDGIYYSWIVGNFFAHTYNSEVDSVLIITEGDQVYYSFDGERHLLYDFDVTPGDTLDLRFPIEMEPTWFEENPDVSTTFRLLIESIEEVFIDNRVLRRVHFKELRETDPYTGEHLWAPKDLGQFYTEKLGFESFILPYIVTGYDENNAICDLKTYSDMSFEYENEDAHCLILSTDDALAKTSLSVVPNPGHSNIQVNVEFMDVENILIYDINGQQLMQSKSETIDVSSLNAGMYILQVADSFGQRKSTKFVKIN